MPSRICDMMLQELTGWALGSKLVEALRAAELGSLLLFQLAPHFLIAVSVLVHPETFSAKVTPLPISGRQSFLGHVCVMPSTCEHRWCYDDRS